MLRRIDPVVAAGEHGNRSGADGLHDGPLHRCRARARTRSHSPHHRDRAPCVRRISRRPPRHCGIRQWQQAAAGECRILPRIAMTGGGSSIICSRVGIIRFAQCEKFNSGRTCRPQFCFGLLAVSRFGSAARSRRAVPGRARLRGPRERRRNIRRDHGRYAGRHCRCE